MGAVFGLGVTLITFAGGHMFSGYGMLMPLAWLCRKNSVSDMPGTPARCWFGNPIGAIVLAAILELASGGGVVRPAKRFLLVEYDIPRGCLGARYTETTPAPLDSAATGAGTPTSKSVPVLLSPSVA